MALVGKAENNLSKSGGEEAQPGVSLLRFIYILCPADSVVVVEALVRMLLDL